jgi:hypothetical protein
MRTKCRPETDDRQGLAASCRWCPNRRPAERAPNEGAVHVQELSGLLSQAGPAGNRPHCGANLDADSANEAARAPAVEESARTTAVTAQLSTFAGLIVPFGSVIGPLTIWLTRRNRDPFIDQAGREALNFGITIAIYGAVLVVAALLLVGIPLLMVGVSPGWCWPRWRRSRRVRASPTGYPLTLRLVR